MTTTTKNKAVFFDRDGTLNVDIAYLHRPEDFIWIEGAKEAIKYVNDQGYLAILVTNQSGVARGYYPEADIKTVYDWMNKELAKIGAHLDALFYCPHHPQGKIPAYTQSCKCRKPDTGMVDERTLLPVSGSSPTQRVKVRRFLPEMNSLRLFMCHLSMRLFLKV